MTSPVPSPSTVGLLSLVYGFTRAETDGWASPVTISLLFVGVVLLVAFVLIERRSSIPLLPLRVVLDRNRGGSFLASLLVGIALFGTLPVPHVLHAERAGLLGPEDRASLSCPSRPGSSSRPPWPARCYHRLGPRA